MKGLTFILSRLPQKDRMRENTAMKLTLLGSGNAQATKIYNTCLLFDDSKERLLVDAGGGNTILSILEKKDIPLSSIRYLFVTHAHIDHLLGVFWVIRRIAEEMNASRYDGLFTVYAHEELIDLIISFSRTTLTKKICSLFGSRIIFIPNRDRESLAMMGGTLTPFDIHSTKLRQFGFTFDYGGMRIVDAGDEPLDGKNEDLAEGADWLTHEAFCLYSDRDIFHPYEKNHSTVRDAAEKGERLRVRNLVLYHTEDRSGIETRKFRYTEEAVKYYSGNVYVPDDGDEIIL